MTKRILIVDDSATGRTIIERTIGPGFFFEYAHNAEMALAAVAADPPDLVLLDLLMPGIGGIGFLKALEGKAEAPPVIVVSADIQDSTRQKVLALGAAALVNKPLKADSINETIRFVLNRAGKSV